jgi:UDP-glucose 4-epimerase
MSLDKILHSAHPNSVIIYFIFLLLQFPINPYGKAKKMAEDIILDFSKNSDMAVMILRFVIFYMANLSQIC